MIEFIQEYLYGENERMWFDQDFNYYLIKHYPKMESENVDLAECFVYYLAEQGFDQTQGLSDIAHKKLIRKQFDEFKAAMDDGMY